MAITEPKKCPYCGSENFDELEIPIGNSFAIPTVPVNNQVAYVHAKVFACTECGLLSFFKEDLMPNHD